MGELNNLNIKYDYAVSKNIKPKVLTADLGDGYQQRAADGINSDPETWTIKWKKRPYSDINTLDNFFKNLGGYESFTWTPPRASSDNKYICPNWRRSYSNIDNDDLTATFIQVWDY